MTDSLFFLGSDAPVYTWRQALDLKIFIGRVMISAGIFRREDYTKKRAFYTSLEGSTIKHNFLRMSHTNNHSVHENETLGCTYTHSLKANLARSTNGTLGGRGPHIAFRITPWSSGNIKKRERRYQLYFCHSNSLSVYKIPNGSSVLRELQFKRIHTGTSHQEVLQRVFVFTSQRNDCVRTCWSCN